MDGAAGGAPSPRPDRRGADRGAAAVEFALVVPLLLALIGGMVDFGFAFNAKMAVTQAAREGARVVALGGTDAAARDRVAQALTVNGQVLPVSTTVQSGCGAGSSTAIVRVQGSVPTLLPVPDITVTGRAVMSCG